ncbi:tetratricopeptide repeat protein [Marixanthomonas ophiurae]|uniref:Tetratricopeptide repeat protein n=1 Tax=Marixanthomonas ophiurae TaxID=387659 RepID=A0A3E1Q6Q7_9FLAO|nr:hypothetical protein [Marixanthomonas ophiurae]RFN57810.1 hypothetical protein DZ858_11230 [Marixanthomonas ophiurae]
MCFHKKIVTFLFLFGVLVFKHAVYAQNKALIDSLRQEANVLAYSNPELAVERGLELFSLSKNKPSQQVSALLTVANAYAVLKDHDKVLKYALKADSIADKNRNYTDQVRALGFIGGQYQRLKLSNRALEYLDRAYTISVKHPLPDSIQYLQGNILFVKGLIQRDNLGCEYALPYFTEAAQVFRENLDKKLMNSSMAIALNNIGDCNFQLEKYDVAKKNYNEAIIFASKINALKNSAYSKLGLAKILSEEEKNQLAIQTLQEALLSVENINDAGLKTALYKALSDNYAAIGNNEKYNAYTKLYFEEEEKLLNEEKNSINQVANNLAAENLDKRENQKNTYTYIFIICGILLLVVLEYILRKILQKRKKIAQQKQEIENTSKNNHN